MTGRELGHYRIEVQLGSGGMGAVYRAVDLRTNQTVALKTLLASALKDVEQRKRFQQEARLASSLKHPNIISVFEIGAAELDGEPVEYIAMELVAGDTLDQLTAGHALAEDAAIGYGIQIASGLAAAHAANIVHRDLKPSNLMVSSDGVVKILDFGLAKWTDPIQPDSFSDTRSVQLGLTMSGTIMGSVAYMSPEQAEGKLLDSRTDIFSFGSVMYRMVSGRDAFQGGSQVSTLSAVLLKDPDPLSQTAPGVSPGLEEIIRKCQRKDPARRWQSMADVALSLEELREELKRPPQQAIAAATASGSTRRQWVMAGAGGLLAGLAPAAYLATRRQPPPTFQRLTFRHGDVLSALFAPGGEIMYSAHWDGSPLGTYSSVTGSRETRELRLPQGRILSLNSSGEALVLGGEELLGTLFRAGLGGGAARPLLEDVVDARWGPDGNSLAVVRSVGGKYRLEYPVGTVLYQTDVRPPTWLRLHPASGTIAFFDYDSEVGDYDVKTVDSSRRINVLSRGWRPIGRLAWSPDGSEVWMSGKRSGENPRLTAVTRDGKERTLAQLPAFMLLHDVAADGSLLLAAMRSRIAIHGKGSLSKQEDLDLSWFDASRIYDISADGAAVLSVEIGYGEGRNSAIYMRKTDGSPAVKIGYGNKPALSPDGKSVVCIFRLEKSSILKILPTGAGEEKALPTEGLKYDDAEWFPDQQRLLVTASVPGKSPRTHWRRIDGGGQVQPVTFDGGRQLNPVTPEGVRASKISPDARWAIGTNEGKFRLYPVESGPAPRDLGSVQPGDQPLRWSGDGAGFYFARPQSSSVEVWLLEIGTGQRRKVREIRYPEEGAEFVALVISPDAKWYALSYQKDLAELYIARGIR